MTRLIAWLGDDFTGAAAVMEALAFAGLPAVLFLDPPTPDQIATFPADASIGIASMARTQSPDWMEANLPDLFSVLRGTGAALLHYKVCSTLDSAPHIGSIGRAMEIGAQMTGAQVVPIVVAAPQMRRYQAFGHLFAGAPQGVFRLDRHPVMANHPVTPMAESDVAAHLARQTDMPVGCLDLEMLHDPVAAARAFTDGPTARGLTCDMMGPSDEAAVGTLIWTHRGENPFVVGSQGVEYALIAHLQATGALDPAPRVASAGRVNRMAVVSGSVSGITADQIGWAAQHGFATIPFAAEAVCSDPATLADTEARCLAVALAALDRGQVPLIQSAAGPQDAGIARLTQAAAGRDMTQVNDAIGKSLGRMLRALVDRARLTRVVASGGDTSGHVTRALDVFALTALAPTIPGAALCKAHAMGATHGLEVALKGGQMGSADYFGWIRDGGGAR
ncbi:four-carbon acid sugar kinase family protein [Loktanella sp. DJP18]|uniref:four-carbon acid sugar kinase family protein n=1 Tax=Loktanella sp. DJP18 TaxID=3409788 RepID=UPI003BB7BE86